jgi:hypothetical protein
MKTKINPEKSEKIEKNVFSKFCQETSLHGWSYLDREKSKVWKGLWFIFLLIIIVLSGYVLVINTKQYLEAFMKTKLQQQSKLQQIIFIVRVT